MHLTTNQRVFLVDQIEPFLKQQLFLVTLAYEQCQHSLMPYILLHTRQTGQIVINRRQN